MKKILLLSFLCPLLSISQSLNGTYNIGSGQPNPFNTLQNAIAHINSVGVNGPVVFQLLNDEFTTSTLEISSYSGSSTINTLTIKPASGRNVTVSVSNPNSYTGIAAVFKINGGDNIIIDGSNGSSATSRNLTLLNSNYVSYVSQTVVWIASNNSNAATNITVKNNILKHSNRNQVGRWLSGVFSGGNGNVANNDLQAQTASANNSNTQIINNQFINIRQGIHINSATGSNRITDVVISKNEMIATIDDEKPDLGIYINNVSNFNIEQNIINGLRSNTSGSSNMYGINILNGLNYSVVGNQILNYSHPSNHMIGSALFIQGNSTSNATITRNIIHNINNSGGGIVRGIDVNISNGIDTNTLIANNFISNVTTNGTTTNNGNGIYIRNGQNISIYHNTVAMNGNQNNIHAALYVGGGSQLKVVNNIFTNTSATGTRYALYSTVSRTAYTIIDYNDYYSTQHIGYLGSNRTTLANWRTATQQDTNSISVLPSFVSSSDLHLTSENPDLDNKGTFLSSVAIDIDLETRSTTTPDMGADEFLAERCSNSTTWNGTYWNNGAPTEDVKAILNGNYNTSTHGDLITCDLTINTNVSATITANHYFKIITDLKVDGSLNIENNGSLIQVENDGLALGQIYVERVSTPMKALDYTYWSSPVSGWKLNQLSPNTSPSRYYSFNASTGNWTSHNGGNIDMQQGKGYIVRAPNGWAIDNETNGVFRGVFKGTANNGIVNINVSKGTNNISNLIGNPYPSAIDIDEFIMNSTNRSLFDGTIYLWTHNTAISNTIPGNYVYNYTADDYASYNLTGGIKTSNAAITGAVAPTGKIASGQGFFIDMKESLTNGTYHGVFNNEMRISGENTQFFRSTDSSTGTEKNRLWLHIQNPNGAYHETLLGYIEGATDELDYGFDGKFIDGGNFVSIYSLLDDDKLSIQGKSLSFNDSDTIPLGYKSSITGSVSIGIEDVDGFFIGKTVYLHDYATGISYNLNDASYTFETVEGVFDNRFELRFTNETLNNEDLDHSTYVQILKHGQSIIVSSALQDIEQVIIYDITGKQLVFTENIKSRIFKMNDLHVEHQVLIVKSILQNNVTITKKVLF